jgi:hypothetical protein
MEDFCINLGRLTPPLSGRIGPHLAIWLFVVCQKDARYLTERALLALAPVHSGLWRQQCANPTAKRD